MQRVDRDYVKSARSNKLLRFYNTLCHYIKVLSLTALLFLIPVFIGLIVYYSVFRFNAWRVIVYCVCLVIVIDSNAKI